MDLHRLQQQCEARLHHLVLPVPFDVDRFRATLEVQRGHPIVCRPMSKLSPVTGIWVGLSSVDIIVHSPAMSRVHREHIILHELCHMLCGHPPTLSDADIAVCTFLNEEFDLRDVDIGARQHVRYRRGYTTEQEQEVELLASLIMDRTQRDQPGTASPERLAAVLEEGARHSA